MSSPRYMMAAWRAHGAGTINEAHVAEPLRNASYTPMLAPWHEPKSSHDKMTALVVGLKPSRAKSDGSLPASAIAPR